MEYIYIYTHRYIKRERERDTYIHIYAYTCECFLDISPYTMLRSGQLRWVPGRPEGSTMGFSRTLHLLSTSLLEQSQGVYLEMHSPPPFLQISIYIYIYRGAQTSAHTYVDIHAHVYIYTMYIYT